MKCNKLNLISLNDDKFNLIYFSVVNIFYINVLMKIFCILYADSFEGQLFSFLAKKR